MERMSNGDLRYYLAEHKPGRYMILSWFTQITQGMAYIHHHRVIIADVRLENFLLDDQLAIKVADFGESSLMPVDWDLNGSNEIGFSRMTDIGQLGAVMYSVVTGEECKFDIWDEGNKSTWPQCDKLPPTGDMWLGQIIEKCWTHGFNSVDDTVEELKTLAKD